MNNPYKGTAVTSRVNVDVSTEHFNYIRAIRPKSGTVQGTVNNLWYKLVNELKKRGITNYDREADFVDFVQRCELILPEERGGTVSGASTEAQVRNDRKRTKRVRPRNPNTEGELAAV